MALVSCYSERSKESGDSIGPRISRSDRNDNAARRRHRACKMFFLPHFHYALLPAQDSRCWLPVLQLIGRVMVLDRIARE